MNPCFNCLYEMEIYVKNCQVVIERYFIICSKITLLKYSPKLFKNIQDGILWKVGDFD